MKDDECRVRVVLARRAIFCGELVCGNCDHARGWSGRGECYLFHTVRGLPRKLRRVGGSGINFHRLKQCIEAERLAKGGAE